VLSAAEPLRTPRRSLNPLLIPLLVCAALLGVAAFYIFARPERTAAPPTETAVSKPQVSQSSSPPEPQSTPSAPNRTPPPSPGTVTGSAFYRLKAGSSVILRGLTIYLLNDEELDKKFPPAKPPEERIDIIIGFQTPKLDMMWNLHELQPDGQRTFFRSIDHLFSQIQKSITGARTKAVTNIDGKYTFSDVPSGQYQLLALLDTAEAKGFWYLPVAVANGQQVTLELNNVNITKVYDGSQ